MIVGAGRWDRILLTANIWSSFLPQSCPCCKKAVPAEPPFEAPHPATTEQISALSVLCFYCKTVQKNSELLAHAIECDQRLVRCESCLLDVPQVNNNSKLLKFSAQNTQKQCSGVVDFADSTKRDFNLPGFRFPWPQFRKKYSKYYFRVSQKVMVKPVLRSVLPVVRSSLRH